MTHAYKNVQRGGWPVDDWACFVVAVLFCVLQRQQKQLLVVLEELYKSSRLLIKQHKLKLKNCFLLNFLKKSEFIYTHTICSGMKVNSYKPGKKKTTTNFFLGTHDWLQV